MKILVIEGVLAGFTKHFDASIFPEALSMLISFSSDVAELGHKTSILVHKRFLDYIPPDRLKKEITVVKNIEEDINFLHKIAVKYDYIYVIAPESDGLLYNLLTILEGSHINSEPDSVAKASNKFKVMNDLKNLNINVPKTLYLEGKKEESIQYIVEELGFPLIVKPNVGTGCQGLKVIKDRDELEKHLRELRESYKSFILQEYIKGIPASISVISSGNYYKILSVNRQFIKLREPGYWGGYTPIRNINLKNIRDIAGKICRLYNGLKGYFGIDIIISKDKIFVTEINPRLTVSYTGISNILSVNPAKLILESIFKRKIKSEISYRYTAYFRKIRFKNQLTKKSAYKIYRLYNLYTPPLPFLNPKAYAFTLMTGSSLRETTRYFKDLIVKLTRNLKTSITV